jgi:hypothetical protein
MSTCRGRSRRPRVRLSPSLTKGALFRHMPSDSSFKEIAALQSPLNTVGAPSKRYGRLVDCRQWVRLRHSELKIGFETRNATFDHLTSIKVTRRVAAFSRT